jgi:hypothetical protein
MAEPVCRAAEGCPFRRKRWYKDGMCARGRFRIILLYDVAESIDLEKVRGLLGPRAEAVKSVFPRGTPQYIRFERPPIVEPGEPIAFAGGGQVTSSIKYYGFAAVVVEMEAPFECEWNALPAEEARWLDAPDLKRQAREMLRRHLDQISGAVLRPTRKWLEEEYFVVELRDAAREGKPRESAAELLAEHGPEIVQLVRGESTPLAPRVSEEVLENSLSYYPSDMVVVGPTAALVFDRSEDAAATIQVLEYARMQLLEFRYYDALMTQVLSDVYVALERKKNVLFSRWTLPREAKRFNTIRLDVMELTERIDSAIKFVSDVYYARVYDLAAKRMGVTDYRDLVEGKLQTAGELYDFMMDQFNEARSFVLEAAIVLLLVLDVILIFSGK